MDPLISSGISNVSEKELVLPSRESSTGNPLGVIVVVPSGFPLPPTPSHDGITTPLPPKVDLMVRSFIIPPLLFPAGTSGAILALPRDALSSTHLAPVVKGRGRSKDLSSRLIELSVGFPVEAFIEVEKGEETKIIGDSRDGMSVSVATRSHEQFSHLSAPQRLIWGFREFRRHPTGKHQSKKRHAAVRQYAQ